MAISVSNLLLFCLFLFFIDPSIAKTSVRPKALVLPVSKDASTLQYLTILNQRTPSVPIKLTLDLGGQYMWVDCEQGYVSSSYKSVPCRSAQCSLTKSKECINECFSTPKPGCTNSTCLLFPDNTVTHTAGSSVVGQDVVSVQSTDGSNPGRVVSAPKVIFNCAFTFLLEGLANGVKGMAGLGRTKISLPSQFSATFSFPRKFAICLPSENFDVVGVGVVFFGDGPYVFLPDSDLRANVDVSKSLIYTPLILNPVSTASASFQGDPSSEYFIGVKSIKINGKPVPVNTTLLSINKEGFGGTKISTVDPYTVLETTIYKAVITAFSKAFARVPKVAAVAPFGLCFNSTNIGSARFGPDIPQIDLVLQSSTVFWSIYGANSLVQVKKDVICLGFVDGGANPRTSIVIGGYQLEDNLLQFDLAASKLGFSSSLFYSHTACANFNFTSNLIN